MDRKIGIVTASILCTALMATGCGKSKTGPQTKAAGEAGSPASAVDQQQADLTLWVNWSDDSDDFIQKHITDPLKTKFPKVTFQIERNGKGFSAEEMVASGTIPDLILTSGGQIANMFSPLNMLYDMNDLIKKDNFDVSKVKSYLMDMIKIQADHGETYALPLYDNSLYATFYNKDIFDKFGLAYPTDGMTWEDYLNLNKKITRQADGTQYYGIGPSDTVTGLEKYDLKTGKAMLDSDAWVKQLQFMNQFYSIPGAEYGKVDYGRGAFLTGKGAAMTAFYFSFINELIKAEAQGKSINWDIATLPWVSQHPGIGWHVDSHFFSIGAASKYKELDFKILQFLLSPDRQMELAKDGHMSVLQDVSYEKNFASNIPELKGKNLSALFKTKPMPFEKPNKYDGIANKYLKNAKTEIFKNRNLDIVGVLRKANEGANQEIASVKQ